MEVAINQKGEETVIGIGGRLDTNMTRGCKGKALPIWKNPGVKIRIDCSDLECVSNAGLRLSLTLQEITTTKEGSLRLIDMRSIVRKTLDLTGFSALFKIEDTKQV